MLATMSAEEKIVRRAGGPRLPLLRLQIRLRVSPWAFAILWGLPIFLIGLLPLLVRGPSAELVMELLGPALFFGTSIALVAGMNHMLFEGAAADFLALAPLLPFDEAAAARWEAALSRESTGKQWAVTAIGIGCGLLHSYLLGIFGLPLVFAISQIVPTMTLWIVMFWTVPALIANAVLFARLGRLAKPDLLRPSRHAAFGAAALRPALFLVGILCAYLFLIAFDRDGLSPAVLIGFTVPLMSLAIIVIMPLRGIRIGIATVRRRTLAALDARVESIGPAELGEVPADKLRELDTLLDMRERVAQAPAWPFDLAGVRRILLYAVLPPFTWAAAALVEILIDQLL
jgi:hypothetical protein